MPTIELPTIVSLVIRSIIDNAPYLSGFLLPFINDYLNQEVSDKRNRQLIAGVSCLFFTLLIQWDALLAGNLGDAAAVYGILFTESQGMYKLYFEDSALRERFNSIKVLFPEKQEPQQGQTQQPII